MHSPRRFFGKSVKITIPAELADEATLLAYLGMSPAELKKIWWGRGRMYREFNIAKASGKSRLIVAPDRRLKMIQQKIALLLDQLYRVRNPVHGFAAQRSVKTNAEAHGGRRFVVNLDLDDFFGSITENRVVGLLTAVGLQDRVAKVIGRLCCRAGKLPQGAPSSPVLSNMICYRLDTDLMQIAKAGRCIYTRYADDITFSSYQPPAPLFEGALPAAGRFSPDLLAANLKAAFAANSFTLNQAKAHYADRNSRRMVTGVKINAGLNLDRRYIRQIRAILHSVERENLVNAQQRYADGGGKGALADHLRGKIAWVTHLKGPADPVVRSLASRFNESFKARPIRLAPTVEEMRDRSVWVLEHPGDTGSCFFLKDVGLVTAAHCVDGVMEVDVFHPTKHTTTFAAKVLHRDKHRDLAILDASTIPPSEFFELSQAVRPVAVTERVTALGYPGWGYGERLNVRSGDVTSLTNRSLVPLIEVSQQLTQGMSGGPIVNMNGEVVGIVHKGGPHEGRQLAIRATEIAEAAKMPADL